MMNARTPFGKRTETQKEARDLRTNPFGELSLIDDTANDLFESALPSFAPDDSLLKGMPAQELQKAIKKMVAAMRELDGERAFRKFSWFERIRGIDLEARLQFELSAAEMDGLLNQAIVALHRAQKAADAIVQDAQLLEQTEVQQGLLIDHATGALKHLPSDEFHRSRFEKRLANLEAVYASNRMLKQQYQLAYQNLKRLIDRLSDVEMLLYPLWQQHIFALTHNSGASSKQDHDMRELLDIKSKIEGALTDSQE